MFADGASLTVPDGVSLASADRAPMTSHLEQSLAAGEQARGEPHELQASLLAQPAAVVRQLLHDLTVDLVTQDLLRKHEVISAQRVISWRNPKCHGVTRPSASVLVLKWTGARPILYRSANKIINNRASTSIFQSSATNSTNFTSCILRTNVFERSVEDGVGELVAAAGPLAGQVAHVLQDGGEGGAGLLGQLLLVLQLLEQRQLQRIARVPPQVVPVAAGCHLQTARHGPLGRRPGGRRANSGRPAHATQTV